MLLLIDNYDSFTYNLVHYLGELGADVVIRRNDAVDVQEAIAMNPAGILLSPGPCDPDQAGICLALTEAAAETGTPLMGVCLGHQTIGQVFGGKVVRCNEIVHGKMGVMHHTGQGLFKGLPSPFDATRYHSLIVDRDTLPDCLNVTAELTDGTIMGLQHQSLPIHGVQFHPELTAGTVAGWLQDEDTFGAAIRWLGSEHKARNLVAAGDAVADDLLQISAEIWTRFRGLADHLSR